MRYKKSNSIIYKKFFQFFILFFWSEEQKIFKIKDDFTIILHYVVILSLGIRIRSI